MSSSVRPPSTNTVNVLRVENTLHRGGASTNLHPYSELHHRSERTDRRAIGRSSCALFNPTRNIPNSCCSLLPDTHPMSLFKPGYHHRIPSGTTPHTCRSDKSGPQRMDNRACSDRPPVRVPLHSFRARHPQLSHAAHWYPGETLGWRSLGSGLVV
jgi:hypothetical protein